jgi:hypothetical protein
MADVFWNLIQLSRTDPVFAKGYEDIVDNLGRAANLSLGQIGILVITKYTNRLYQNQGKTNHYLEDAQIEQLLFGVPNGQEKLVPLLPSMDEQRATIIYDVMQKVVKPMLMARLEQMKGAKQFSDLATLYPELAQD